MLRSVLFWYLTLDYLIYSFVRIFRVAILIAVFPIRAAVKFAAAVVVISPSPSSSSSCLAPGGTTLDCTMWSFVIGVVRLALLLLRFALLLPRLAMLLLLTGLLLPVSVSCVFDMPSSVPDVSGEGEKLLMTTFWSDPSLSTLDSWSVSRKADVSRVACDVISGSLWPR